MSGEYQENIQFCRIGRGSVEELIDDFNICLDESYCDAGTTEELESHVYALVNRINGYVAYLRKSRQGFDSP